MKLMHLKLFIICSIGLLGIHFSGSRDGIKQIQDNSLHSDYVGYQACRECHADIYEKFRQSGHFHKLTKVQQGKTPKYPFSSLPNILPDRGKGLKDCNNSLGSPRSFHDISYVIGGYGWKARFIDKNGYLFTGSDTQYNYENRKWTAFKKNISDAPYRCGKCHTTGWIPFEKGKQRKDRMPGMGGVFFAGGIHCEACHGPGKAHVKHRGDIQYIKRDLSSKLCGKCHTRDSENRISASGGFIKHHEQYDELLGLNPYDVNRKGLGKHLKNGVGCNGCHDVHATTVYRDQSKNRGIKKRCIDCHADKRITRGPHTMDQFKKRGLHNKGRNIASNCILCHMPMISKSAVGHAAVGSAPKMGDIRSHIFKINLSKKEQFTPDQKFAFPWITAEYACRQCHNGINARIIFNTQRIKIHQ